MRMQLSLVPPYSQDNLHRIPKELLIKKKKSGKEHLPESDRMHFARILFLPIENDHIKKTFDTGATIMGLRLDSATKCKLKACERQGGRERKDQRARKERGLPGKNSLIDT